MTTLEQDVSAALEAAAAGEARHREALGANPWRRDVAVDDSLEIFVREIPDEHVEHLAEITAVMYAERPHDRTISKLDGLVSTRLLRIKRQPSDEQMEAGRAAAAAARAEYRAARAVGDSEFWALVDEEVGGVCPACGTPYGSVPARIGEWKIRCRGVKADRTWTELCGHEHDFYPAWRERYREQLAAVEAA